MLDKNLTIDQRFNEIGEVILEQRLVLTEGSEIVQAYKQWLFAIEQGKREGIVSFDENTGEFRTDSDEKRDRLQQLEMGPHWVKMRQSLGLIKTEEQFIDYDDIYSFTDTLIEAIANAIEYGTDFCTKGDVEIHIKIGSNGMLAVVSQPNPGITLETIFKHRPYDGQPFIIAEKHNGIRRFWNPRKARIWFEFYTEENQKFKAIILETRKNWEELRNGWPEVESL